MKGKTRWLVSAPTLEKYYYDEKPRWIPDEYLIEVQDTNEIERTKSDTAAAELTPAELLFNDKHWVEYTALEKANARIEKLRAALKAIWEHAKTGDGTSTECHMAYLADDILEEDEK